MTVCVVLMLLLPLVSLFAAQDANQPASQARTAVNPCPDFDLSPSCGMSIPSSQHDYFRTMDPASKLLCGNAASSHLFKAPAGKSPGVSTIAFRNMAQTSQLQYHNHLFLEPFFGHAPPEFI